MRMKKPVVRDRAKDATFSLPGIARPVGRPCDPNAKTAAERQRLFRQRQKEQRLFEQEAADQKAYERAGEFPLSVTEMDIGGWIDA